MEKHIIALDLDGTLLTDQKTISEKNLKTIQAAKEAGHIVVIATGRPHRGSKQYYAQMDLTTPMVNMNGAYVHHQEIKVGVSNIHQCLKIRHTIFSILRITMAQKTSWLRLLTKYILKKTTRVS